MEVASRRAGVTLIEMMVVVTIIALLTGVAYPSLTAGMAGIRLTSAAGTVASFLTSSMNRVERREQAAALVVLSKENRIERFTTSDKPDGVLEMPPGVSIEGIEGDPPRRIILQPGGTVPRITIYLRNEKGARRAIGVDPVTGVPRIERPDEVKK